MSEDWAYQQRREQIRAAACRMLCDQNLWREDSFLESFGYPKDYAVTLTMANSESFAPAELINAMRSQILQYVVSHPEKEYPHPHIPDRSDQRSLLKRHQAPTMPEFRNWAERIRYCLDPENHRGRDAALIEYQLRNDPLVEELMKQTESLFCATPAEDFAPPAKQGEDEGLPEDRQDTRSYNIRIHPALLDDFRNEQSKLRDTL